MFAVAAVATNVSALPVGALLDRYGPRVAAIIGTGLFTTGCLLFALASRLPFDGYIPGFLFMALGGPFIFMPAFQLSNAFPTHSGLVLSLLTGAFDASSAVFLVYRLIYEQSHRSVTPEKFFLVYLIVPALILAAQVFLMPARSYKTMGELARQAKDSCDDDLEDVEHHMNGDAAYVEHRREERRMQRASVVDEVTELLGTGKGARQTEEEEKKQKISGVWGALHGESARRQILSAYFILITLFTIIQMTRINYFIATVRNQYSKLLGDNKAAVRINSLFDIALPVGGVVAAPFVGYILDNTSTPFVLGLLVFFATTIGVLGVISSLWTAYLNVVLFVLYRPFFYTAIS